MYNISLLGEGSSSSLQDSGISFGGSFSMDRTGLGFSTPVKGSLESEKMKIIHETSLSPIDKESNSILHSFKSPPAKILDVSDTVVSSAAESDRM